MSATERHYSVRRLPDARASGNGAMFCCGYRNRSWFGFTNGYGSKWPRQITRQVRSPLS